MSKLRVTANGTLVGTLAVIGGRWSFNYAPDWSAYALSPSLPLATREYQDSGDVRLVEWFFENLLPEGRLRELIASRDRIDPSDTWALLIRHGQDTAGALSLLPDEAGEIQIEQEILLPLSREALQEKIEESRTRNLPLMASWDDVRMSLAGAQEKLGLRIDTQGAMFLPEGTAASTHIVKPENASADFPFCPANEFFCMRLAAELKVPVPNVDLKHLPEPLYVIERFDRESSDPKGEPGGAAIRRLHQIDLCQALGVSPSKKYESEGGLGLHHLFEVLRGTFIDRPVIAANAVVQWVAFNYLIGNLDAHAKNIAFLMRGQKAVVAPFYDMLCVEAYLPRATMSMAIAGENKPGWVEGIHWDAMAFEAGVAPRLVRGVLSRMNSDLPDAISKVIGDERLLPTERDFIREKALPVIEERRGFVTDALKGRQSTVIELLSRRELDPEVVERLKALSRST
ncbi:HipA domain-containing protein [Denitratisoma oestradiolicum]|uniref:Phosphatidylinositol kinase n=1 Tax=Denitratisoma oestradiolicum TaxID=311182 RepID=A0A6S6XXL0_9PROT|nr:HipA domain-containing protein [Denitratisoma oestradiolicum]TWO82131.1 phosphatidylinositol kinase [Denitratisoma oestradiolicum]CAB1369065.1 Phosphatidylinositol kinase [Denitratisoma oestradiolicum]